MILAFLAKGKTWSVTQYAFHTLFPVVTSDLLYRLLGLFFIPLLLNLPVAEVGSNALSISYLRLFATYLYLIVSWAWI